MGAGVHVEFGFAAEGGHPHVQPTNFLHMPMQGTVPIIIVSPIVIRAQHRQVRGCGFPTVFKSHHMVRLAIIRTDPAPIGHTHRVNKPEHLTLIRISKPGIRILWIQAEQPQVLTSDVADSQG